MEQNFINLQHDKLLQCQKVNASWNLLLKNPIIWLKICFKNGLMYRLGKERLKIKVNQTCNDQVSKGKMLSSFMEINRQMSRQI